MGLMAQFKNYPKSQGLGAHTREVPGLIQYFSKPPNFANMFTEAVLFVVQDIDVDRNLCQLGSEP